MASVSTAWRRTIDSGFRTQNSTYEIVVVALPPSSGPRRGASVFRAFTPAHVSGASLGGSFLKLHSVHVGFRIELAADGDRFFITSPVQSITIDRGQDPPLRVM